MIYIMTKQKSITIKDKHEKWIQENHINLSRFVKSKIEERINNEE